VTDTIFALSSGAPPSAIAVVRVSGPQAHRALECLAGPLPPARSMTLRTIRNGHGETLDRSLVVQFPADASVTGEPLVELHLHGGRATVDAVLDELGHLPGLRPARAGEFTWQAFRNGHMDLVEVESLSDLLRAETESQRRAAMAGRGLSVFVERCRQQLLHLSALVEAELDQSDEDDVAVDRRERDALTSRLEEELAQLLDRPGAERLFDGIRVVFAGPPNAGKSTLINTIAQRDAAIVSAIPGTTRDVIEVPVKIGGIAFLLTDTAGLRAEFSDAVEKEGIARAEQRIAEADIVVWLGDEGEAPPTAVRIHPRADETGREASPPDRMRVSARTGEGISSLIALLTSSARAMLPVEGEIALTRRQRALLFDCRLEMSKFASETDEIIAAEHLRRSRSAIDALSGRAGTEEMLDSLFGTFCIGK
jgi:tRNA modification GTPase